MNEMREALRFLVRVPRTAAAAIVCIGIGTAAVSAMSSLLSATLLERLPFPASERLVRVWMHDEAGSERQPLALPDVADLRQGAAAFDRVEAALRARLVFVGREGGRRVEGESVTEGYFELLGATLSRGRFFTPDEHRDPRAGVILLTYEAWGRLYGFEESAIGSTIATPEANFTIVGVMASDFGGTIEEDAGEIEFWIPTSPAAIPPADRAGGTAWVIARLRAEDAMTRAQAEVRRIGEQLALSYPTQRAGTSLGVEPIGERWRSGLRQSLWLLLGAAALLLIVAATNVAGLMLARGLSRRRELAVRAAMGASRRRMMALLSLESLLAAAIGGLLGAVLGPVFLRTFVGAVALPLPAYVELETSTIALAITGLILSGTAVIAAVLPFMALGRAQPASVLRGSGRGATAGPRDRRWGNALVILEVALATVVLFASALLLRSYQSLTTADLGFRTDSMLRVALFVNGNDAQAETDVVSLQERAIEEIARQPGVTAVARVWPTAPLVAAPLTAIRYGGMDARRAETGEIVALYAVDPNAFDVLDIALVAGRGVTQTDHAAAEPIVVISSSLAQRMGGQERALGTMIQALGTERRVVGIVADAHLTGPRAPPHEALQLYLPLAQRPDRTVSFAIRTTTDHPEDVLPDVRSVLSSLAPTSAIDWTDSFVSALGFGFARDRFLLALTTVFSGVTVFLAAVGLFALLAFSVTRARTEIGVRQALGATRAHVVSSIVRHGVILVAIGLGVGLSLSLLIGRVYASIVYDVEAFDPTALAATTITLLAVGVFASALPARRAASVSPARALQSE